MRYELAMMARKCTNNLMVVLSPLVQHCHCEHSFLFHSIRLDELVKVALAILGRKMAILATFFEI